MDKGRLIYQHGLESTSNSGRARLFREWFPGMLTPDFTGSFDERMTQLGPIISDTNNWTIIDSSFGGLMRATFTIDHPNRVWKLILPAPALILDPSPPDLTSSQFPFQPSSPRDAGYCNPAETCTPYCTTNFHGPNLSQR